MQATFYEEMQVKIRLQMELDAKDSEIEQLNSKLVNLSSETLSVNSTGNDNDWDEGGK